MIVDHRAAFFADLEEQWMAVSGDGLFAGLRERAWERFKTMGFPGRKHESYKYFPLNPLYSEHFDRALPVQLTVSDVEPFILPECKFSYIVFVNGYLDLELSCLEGIEGGGIVRSLDEAARSYGDFIRGHLNQQSQKEDDPFALLHAALYQEGCFIHLPAKSKLDAPVQIMNINVNRSAPICVLPKVQVFAAKETAAQFIVTTHAMGSESLFTHLHLDFVLEAGANIDCTQVLFDPHVRWAFSSLRALVKSEATLNSLHLASPLVVARFDYGIDLVSEHARADIKGAGIGSEKSSLHTHVDMRHLAPDTSSSQLFKGALSSNSLSAFSGKIFVDSTAQQTDAFQLCRHLLLDPSAKAYAKPSLEIYADDVKASHGATCGPLESGPSFYLAARGLDEKVIRQFLIRAYFKDLEELIDFECMQHIFLRHLETLSVSS